jgi:hypothetical protein
MNQQVAKKMAKDRELSRLTKGVTQSLRDLDLFRSDLDAFF